MSTSTTNGNKFKWHKKKKHWQTKLRQRCQLRMITSVKSRPFIHESPWQLSISWNREKNNLLLFLEPQQITNINTWRVCQNEFTNLWLEIICCQTLFLSLWGNKTQSQLQTSKTSESTGSLSLAERWTITEICWQTNSVLTYSQLTDFLL